MGTIDHTLTELPDHITNVNLAKDMIIANLHNEGHLDTETAKMYLNEYHVLLLKRSWIRRIWDRLKSFGRDNGYYYEFVKFQNCNVNSDIELPHNEDIEDESEE